MIELTENTVDVWLSDAEAFTYDFMRYADACAKSVGMSLSFSRADLTESHREWATMCGEWKAHRFEQGVESLSYTKIFSILLYCLTRRTFVTEMRKYSSSGRRSDFDFDGSLEERSEAAADLSGAPEAVSALDFCVAVNGFYEQARVDRNEIYSPRMTMSVRHDLIHLITTGTPTALDVYMAIKPIFSRG
ncbi:hypothetical protein ELH53_29630 (plasmid) [Rhizobium ruizarguesonis]|uniref:hypothetical protein n=1 Tax=Rhizobium ruizarguesonis TaxID=2081791 RepID=UPI00103245EB|nr:hypothetical protein [Rhizobium ruizarguesonis]TBA76697.1 hypothetical protein ELH53_29630 [Rhizobium ruizarguesonis]